MQQIYLLESLVTGYARKAMKTINDITHHSHRATIDHRVKVINFFDRYGEGATKDAFGVSRSTVYLWKQKLKNNRGRLSALAPGDKAPKARRKRTVDPRITNYIIEQRTRYPGKGKDKLAVELAGFCPGRGIPPPSASTVGRIINDLRHQNRLPQHTQLSLNGRTGKLQEKTSKPKPRKQRRGGYRPQAPGDLVQIDTVVKFIDGIRRYVITAVDYQSRFAFAYAYKSPASANAADFLDKLVAVAPFEVAHLHHDNGSEFYKHFISACGAHRITQFWNYPKKPRCNGMVERFNRTIQEEYIDYRLDELALDIDDFNRHLMDWLVYYNTGRPHHGLKLGSPMQHIMGLLQLPTKESNMLWTNTFN